MVEVIEVLERESHLANCFWCGAEYWMVFVYRLDGKTRYRGEHVCKDVADDPHMMTITIERVRTPQ